jgi:arylsulfatase A-like enzyme
MPVLRRSRYVTPRPFGGTGPVSLPPSTRGDITVTHTRRRTSTLLMVGLALAAGRARAQDSAPPRTPDIVVILADDLGYGDLGCYGATKVKTPNLDRLAAAGMRFTDAHSPSAVCSPTRYGLLTGRYAWRTSLKQGVCQPNAPLLIERGRTTLASMLKGRGYATAVVGKWHLGFGDDEPDWNGALQPGPLEVGFDAFFGIPVVNMWQPLVFVENHRVVGLDPADPITDVKTGTLTGGVAARIPLEQIDVRQAEKAVAWIESVPRETPLFLFFATSTIHEPCQPHPRFQGTSGCGARGDCVHEHDWCVGQILDALERTGRAGNALVMHSSDNGGMPPYVNGRPGELREGDHRPNGSLRGKKWELWEGGHRVPMIVRWPGHTPAGTVSGELVCLIDVLATCAEILGQPLPEDAGEDSFSFLPVMLGRQPATPRPPLVMHDLQGRFAIRDGAWKLSFGKAGPASGGSPRPAGMLVNLEQDPGETTDLRAEQPEIVARLTAQLEKIEQDGRSRP